LEKITISSEEDITEITEFTDQEFVQVQTVNAQIKQHDWLNGERRELMIFNNQHCYQKTRTRKGGKKKFRANLQFLNSIPQTRSSVSYRHIVTGLVLMSLAVIGLIMNITATADLTLLVKYLSSGLLLASFIVLFMGVNRSRQRVVFSSQFGNAPILELINKSPNSKVFNQFLRELKEKIQLSKPRRSVVNRKMLQLELKELKRLKKEGVLSNQAFNKAMQLIVNNRSYSIK